MALQLIEFELDAGCTSFARLPRPQFEFEMPLSTLKFEIADLKNCVHIVRTVNRRTITATVSTNYPQSLKPNSLITSRRWLASESSSLIAPPAGFVPGPS
jgi:hypothetical protein